MSDLLALPTLPDHIGPLRSNEEYEALRERHPGFHRAASPCITCGGKKIFLHLNVRGEVGEYECPCREQWMLYMHLLNSGLDVGHQRMSWDDIDAQVPGDVLDAVINYVEKADSYVRAGVGLILRGDHGTGKTLLATLLLKKLIQRGHDGYFVSAHDLVETYTGGWKKDAEKRLFNRYLSASFLVIDEVGREGKGRQNITDTLFDHLVRRRVAGDKPTIITTNMSMEELRTGYGGSVMSLLAEHNTSIEVAGGDYRPRRNVRLQAEIEKGAVRPLVLE